MRLLLLFASLCGVASAHAQWDLQNSGTTASLRGIHAIGNGVAWASGSGGTVLRTLNQGKTWTRCTTPPGADKLDLRGVQAVDADTALVISIGTGELSRIYKTADGCKSWREVFRNPDAKGFFDGILLATSRQIFVVGDPVDGKFAMFTSRDVGDHWFITDDPGLETPAGGGVFAASNSSLIHMGSFLMFGTGGPRAAVYTTSNHCDAKTGVCEMRWEPHDTPIAHGAEAAGIFSLAGRFAASQTGRVSSVLVAVGGAYDKPNESSGAAAFSPDGGTTWKPAETMPHGFRSAVAVDAAHSTWIAVGPTGSDISTDDGRNWRALPSSGTDADQGWNALSLPFVVGAKGRIAILRDGSLGAR